MRRMSAGAPVANILLGGRYVSARACAWAARVKESAPIPRRSQFDRMFTQMV